MHVGRRADHETVGKPVRIEDDVWLGAGVTILKGVTIGRAAVLGAGIVVTKDVPPGAVVVGTALTRVLRMLET